MTDRRFSFNLVEKCNLGAFENFVSLGFCCHIAGDLEKLGLRSHSMPFDWNVTYWRTIENSIKTHFSDYLVYDKLFQFKNHLHVYENCEAGVSFVHDFVDYLPLDKQFKKVEQKYNRRIKAFYQCIEKPTLFFRYCLNKEEVYYVDQHYTDIINMIKKYNDQNEIVFLSHDDINVNALNNIENFFLIQKAITERESTSPLIGCKFLNELLSSAKFPKREANLKFYKMKHDNTSLKYKLQRKCKRLNKKWIRVVHKKYVHDKQI